jgi:hypothetical protein
MTFKGTTLNTVSGVLLNIQRQYVGQGGIYKTVEIEKTDDYGVAIGYFDLLNNGVYSITATYNGQVIGTFPSISLYCISGQTCAINLYAAPSGAAIPNTNNLYNVAYSSSLNTTSRIVTVSFNTLDSSVSTFNLVVNTDDAVLNNICNTSVTTSAGTLSCYVPPSYGNANLVVYFYKDGTEIAPWFFNFGSVNNLGGNIVVIAMLIFLTLLTMFIPDVRAVLIMDGVGFLLTAALAGLGGGMFSRVGTASVTFGLWIIIVVGILVYKYRSRE